MPQRFFYDTQASKFVKNLLSTEALPLYSEATDDKYLIKDCLYTHKNNIVKCTKTGYMKDDNPEKQAEITYINRYDQENQKKYTYSYMSNCYYYDSLTHRYLGEYLRYLRDWKGLDLMPFYNCFNYQVIEELYLTENSSKHHVLRYNSDFKLFSIPIKFGQVYTIALECPEQVQCMCVIHSDIGMVSKLGELDSKGNKKYFTDDPLIQKTYRSFNSLQFNKPFLFSVSLDDDQLSDATKKSFYDREKDLYLVIQVPSDITTSLVVLEGNFIPDTISTTRTHVCNHKYVKNLFLLQANTNESYAFSDRLFEYLTLNVICKTETLVGNIARIQDLLAKIDDDYWYRLSTSQSIYGVWDDDICRAVDLITSKYLEDIYISDLDGNINKDVEALLYKEYYKHGV